MRSSMALLAVAFLCLIAFPTTIVGKNLKFWPKPIEGWPNPSEISSNGMFMSTAHKFNYGDSKVMRCTYSNGPGPAISISTPTYTPTPSLPPPTPSPPPPTLSPPPPTPSPPPPTPKKSPPPPTPSPPPPTPKKSPSPPPPTPSIPTFTPLILTPPKPSPPPPTPSPPPSTPKTSPPPPTPKTSPSTPKPSLPPTTPKTSPSLPTPSNPPQEHHHHQYQYPWEHFGVCVRNMGDVTRCRMQMEFSYFTRMFQVSKDCCDLVVNMKNECDDVIWGYFSDPFFVPLVRFTCHVSF